MAWVQVVEKPRLVPLLYLIELIVATFAQNTARYRTS
jgi:hypothetical protein